MATSAHQSQPGPYGNEVAEAIYQARTSVTAVAEAVGIPRSSMSEIVNGWRLPSAEQLEAIIAHLGWDAERLYPTREFRDAITATRKADEAGEAIA